MYVSKFRKILIWTHNNDEKNPLSTNPTIFNVIQLFIRKSIDLSIHHKIDKSINISYI